ncbi:MAG: DUF302 domain-containing protein [Spirochaetota bacterium]|nr:DUF302 domain-containing protein [Spirochaetota bacterium]
MNKFSLLLLLLINPMFAQEVIEEKLTISVEVAVKKLEKTLLSKGLVIFAKIDHQKGAKEVKLEMKPSVIVIFGNPLVGTTLMNNNMAWSYELPLKIAIYEDVLGQVWARSRELTKDINSPEVALKITSMNSLLKQLVQIK